MARSIYKLILNNSCMAFSPKVKKKFNALFNKKFDKKPDFVFWNPHTFFSPICLNKRVAIHSGNVFSLVQVRSSMIFSRVSSFVRTKRTGSAIHLVKRRKRK